ncbi:hypothetical protein FFI89_018840 [Bradyrhizobium sp. KBS0727]|uniref:hypothetical protein n=1 Tax=unclassified Bradyrhizobium TaxID=2631580 RepID=UPI00110D58C3|nr:MULTISPECIES: hypothetical protein [unclassified Bradyrhizobium]QDW39023.1 hypothetical protein FFI71_018840 [Bradyrhizobium sp. KBS0725]QDW45626.1 hypothetical protein FFI89_018840 [Bradyrhizobium sp. KBS0727]
MMNFLDHVCDAAPLYFLGGSICLLALLLAVLIAVIAWPFNSPVRLSDEAALPPRRPYPPRPVFGQRQMDEPGDFDPSRLPRRWQP